MHVAASRPASLPSSVVFRLGLSLLLACAGLVAVNGATPGIVVADAWARAAPNGRNGAVFMTVENRRATATAIVSAASPAARVAELHEMAMQGDVMRMRRVDRIALPATGRVELKPGGLHVMLIDLVKPLAAGETVALTLTLDDGTTVRVAATVRETGGH
jgi:copper(I)-binding protein